ncbi:MAG: methionine--tRNA ligase [Acidobacteriaceae bacterium]|nr:methionine--tRNA ligase [Acidobacteriaceae bacterium]MBV9764489.1 methionine--tRNA ligase [Acidobacteriaceae bacterium]
MSKGKYYLTTPIYYVNAAPHIGHAYTTIAAETIARVKRMEGYDVVLTTGTDEHGTKVERAARAQGKTPEEFVDLISNEFRGEWRRLDLQIDRFQRTTAANHAKLVNALFDACRANGYIYKGSYTGMYAVVSESFVNDAKPGDIDPETGKPYEQVTEENYFFRLSAFTERLLEFYDANPNFIQPEIRRNEVLSFVRQGLADLSITRTSIKWGIPVDADPAHVFYVWFDALTTYISAVEGEKCWPADLHLIGKEILRFHAVYWPAFLMAAGWELPKRIFAHGWLLFEHDKMSKSRGNIVRPGPILEVMGADALRYFLLREIVFGQDGSFSYDALIGRYNSDLANGLGNLASRTLNMIQQYRAGIIPEGGQDDAIIRAVLPTVSAVLSAYDSLDFSRALEQIWSIISLIDKYIVERAPWKLAKDSSEDSRKRLDETLYNAAEALRIICALAHPVLPHGTETIWRDLGFMESISRIRVEESKWGGLKGGQKIGTVGPVFPRLELKPTIQKMEELESKEKSRQAALVGKPAEAGASPERAPNTELISIEDFSKVELRVGEVKFAERVKGADKLLHLKVDIGEPEPRTIVAGIALAYKPEQLIGRKVVIVANLQPRKMRGLTSQGMIVAASLEGDVPMLAGFIEDVPVGARLK